MSNHLPAQDRVGELHCQRMPKPSKHKRKGPKSTRAGCLLCKPHKDQKVKGSQATKTRQEMRAEARENE